MESVNNKINDNGNELLDLNEVEVNDIYDGPRLELSAKQELFLELINSDRMLPSGWGRSKRPRISYFGIMSIDGTLPFNSDGQEFMHEIIASNDKEYIRKSGLAWEDIVANKLFESEIVEIKDDIEKQRKREIGIIGLEKEALDKLLVEFKGQRQDLKNQEHTEDDSRWLKKMQAKEKDAYFRDFALRRGLYSDDSIFNYLDKQKSNRGMNFEPKFAEYYDNDAYQKILNTLFRINKYRLSPEKAQERSTLAANAVKRNDLIDKITNDTGFDACSDIERIDSDMSEYIKIYNHYDNIKSAWWNGGFASGLNKHGQYISRYSEVKRVNDHFARQLNNRTELCKKEIADKINNFKDQLSKALIGDVSIDELYILPTGLVTYADDEKITKPILACDINTADISDDISTEVWSASWNRYMRQNLVKDTAILASGIDMLVSLDPAPNLTKQLFDKYNLKYNNEIIDGETGLFSPNISSYELEVLDVFLEKYGSFIGSIKYDDADQRSSKTINNWRAELNKNIHSVNLNELSIVSQAIKPGDRGFEIEMNEVPADIGNDIEALGLAVQFAIWDNMDESLRADYFGLLGDRVNINQASFVKTFGSFIYNNQKRSEIIARVVFFNQFSKWQKDELDGLEKDFFDRLSCSMKSV